MGAKCFPKIGNHFATNGVFGGRPSKAFQIELEGKMKRGNRTESL